MTDETRKQIERDAIAYTNENYGDKDKQIDIPEAIACWSMGAEDYTSGAIKQDAVATNRTVEEIRDLLNRRIKIGDYNARFYMVSFLKEIEKLKSK